MDCAKNTSSFAWQSLTKSFCQCDAGHQTVDFLYHDTNENNQMSSR